MAYSDKSGMMALELQHYWRLMHDAWARFKANPFDPVLDEIVDELDLLREYTEWPMLRSMCDRALALEIKLRQPLLAAARTPARSVM